MIGNAPNAAAFAGTAGQLKTGTIIEEAFILGKAFSWEDRLTFGADEVKIIVFDQSLYVDYNLTFLPIIIGSSSGPILADFYTNPIFNTADGTELIPSNRREGMPAPKSKLWEFAPADVTLATRFSGDTVFASGVGVGNTNPGANLQGLPFQSILNKAIKVTNADGAGTIVQFKITWFEV